MLQVMRDESQPGEMRLHAAKSAGPYVHPRLAAIEVAETDDEDPLAELLRLIDEADEPKPK
jgi:hypothetical protein